MTLEHVPELGGEGREVIDAALHLIDEEMKIAERLERKAREQWQLMTFFASLAIGGALTAATTKGVEKGWYIAIGALAIVTAVALLAAFILASAMSSARRERGLNPDRLEAYVTELHKRQAFDQVRADLATSLVEIARARATSNDARRETLGHVVTAAQVAAGGSVAVMVVAAAAVLVNA